MGGNIGLLQRSIRLKAFLGGRIVMWNDVNIAALNRMRHFLSPSNLVTLDRFSRVRKSAPFQNLYLLWKAGVYRQHVFEGAGMFSGSLFGRI